MVDRVFSHSCDMRHSCSLVPLSGLRKLQTPPMALPKHPNLLRGGTRLPLSFPGSSSSSFP